MEWGWAPESVDCPGELPPETGATLTCAADFTGEIEQSSGERVLADGVDLLGTRD